MLHNINMDKRIPVPPPDWTATMQHLHRRLSDAEEALSDARRMLDGLAPPPPSNVDPTATVLPRPVALNVDKPEPNQAPHNFAPPVSAGPAPAKRPRNSEDLLMRIIATVGVAVTVVGVGFAVTTAIQAGWLGPLGQLLLGIVTSALAFAGAVVLHSRSRSPVGVAALAITALLIAVLLVQVLITPYGMITPGIGAVLCFILHLGFLAAYRYFSWRAVGWSVFAVGLGLACFYQLHEDFWDYPLARIIFLLPPLSVAATWAGTDARGRSIAALTTIPPLLFLPLDSATQMWFMPYALLIALLLAATSLYSPVAPVADRITLVAAALVWVISLFRAPEFWWSHILAVVLAVGFYAVLRSVPTRLHGRLLTRTVIGCAVFIPLTILVVGVRRIELIVYPESALQSPALYWAIVAMIGSAVFLWLDADNRPHRTPAWITWLITIAILMLPWTASVLSDHTDLHYPMSLVMVAVTVALLLAWGLRTTTILAMGTGAVWATTAVVLLLSMNAVVSAAVQLYAVFEVARTATGGFIIGHAVVSVAWLVVGAWLMLGRHRLPNQTSLVAGTVLAGIALAKLLLYDLQWLSGLVRVIVFLVSGVVLLAVVALRVRHDSPDPPPTAQR